MPNQDQAARAQRTEKPATRSSASPVRVETQSNFSTTPETQQRLPQTPLDPRALRPQDLLRLQRRVGNQAVQRLLATRTLQPKLTVGAAHDPYEEKADQVAEQVMRMPASSDSIVMGGRVQRSVEEEEEELQTKPLADTITPLVQRSAQEEDLQTKRFSAAESFETSNDFESRLSATRGSGSPLPESVRDFMEPRFGTDFSDVRLHSDSESAHLNREVSAQAFTLGSDIYLGAGKTDVTSSEGQQLLAHELTHVVQQTGMQTNRVTRRVQRRPWLDNADQLIYKDNVVADELTFVGNSGGKKNYGAFIPYNKLVGLRDWATNLKQDREKDFGKPSLATLPDAIAKNTKNWNVELRNTIGKLYYEDDHRNLQEAVGSLSMAAVKLLLDAAEYGPLLRREGGGSRLPAAAGKLYIDKTMYASKAEALKSLGVKDVDSYGQVQEVLCESSAEMGEKQFAEWNGADQVLKGSGYIYVSTVVARPSANRLVTANGKNYQEDFSDVGGDAAALGLSFQSLKAPQDTDWIDQLSGGRDEVAQTSTMGKWNALGAVAYHNKYRADKDGVVNTNQNFEWLHVRGAQIGGGTVQGNLVAGTFSANSAMIPYEKQIKKWHDGNHNKIFARFTTKLRDHVLAEEIKIEIYTDKHPELETIDKSTPLELKFYPLTGKVVDKLMGKIHTQQMQEKIKQQKNQPPLHDLLNPALTHEVEPLIPHHVMQQWLKDQPQAPAQSGALVPQSDYGTELAPLFPQQPATDLVLTQTPEFSQLQFSMSPQQIQNLVLLQGGPAQYLQNMNLLLQQFGANLEVHIPLSAPQFKLGSGLRHIKIIRRDPSSFTSSNNALAITSGKHARSEDKSVSLPEEMERWTFRLTLPHEYTGLDLNGPNLPPQLLGLGGGMLGLMHVPFFAPFLNFGGLMPQQQPPLALTHQPQQQKMEEDNEDGEKEK